MYFLGSESSTRELCATTGDDSSEGVVVPVGLKYGSFLRSRSSLAALSFSPTDHQLFMLAVKEEGISRAGGNEGIEFGNDDADEVADSEAMMSSRNR